MRNHEVIIVSNTAKRPVSQYLTRVGRASEELIEEMSLKTCFQPKD